MSKSLFIAILSIVFGTNSYAADFSDKVDKTADVDIKQPASRIELQITPVLTESGVYTLIDNVKKIVANIVLKTIPQGDSTVGPALRMGIRWTPGYPSQTVDTSQFRAKINGIWNSNNEIQLSFWMNGWAFQSSDTTGSYYLMPTATTQVDNLSLYIPKLNGSGNSQQIQIEPDVYKVSLDAAVYH